MVTLNPRAVQEISIFKHGGRAVVGRARSANFIDRSFPPNLHSQQRRGSCSKNLPNQKLPTLVARAPPRPCPVPEIKCSHLSPFFPSPPFSSKSLTSCTFEKITRRPRPSLHQTTLPLYCAAANVNRINLAQT